MPNGNGADTAPPWYFKPVLGPLSVSDITAIVGASLAPMHVGYYKPFLPLGLAGQALLGKEEQYRQQALEQQQREPLAQAITPLWQARYGTAAPQEVVQAVRQSPAGAEFVEPYLKPVTPAKGSYTPEQQTAWKAEVEGLDVAPELRPLLIAAGPVQGRSMLGDIAKTYAPPESDVRSPARFQQDIELARARQRPLQPPVIQTETGFATVDRETGQAIPVTTPEGAQAQPRSLSPTVLANIKGKLASIDVIKKQIERVKTAWKPLKDSWSAGPLGGMTWTKEGKAFDVAVSGLQPFMRQLLRTPGEGAMSDYETRLANAPLPSRWTPQESATEAQIDQLEDLVSAVEAGYRGMLPGKPAPLSQQGAGPGLDRGAGETPPASEAPSTPPQGFVPIKDTIINPATGETMVWRNGQWVPHAP